MRIFPRNFASLAIGILLISFTTFASAATLPPEEVEALKKIGKTLGKTWDFSADPCTTFSTKNTQNIKGFEDSVHCTCNGTVCHITRIALKAQNLPGTLLPELARLTLLQDIDLSRNYLNGTIPLEWGSMKLVNISLLGNRLTGPIPKELAKISTLVNISLEYNQLSGPIPPELGSLPLLEKLRISDLNGSQASFPPLNNLTSLKTLILRSCNISGPVPEYLGTMTKLKLLDLSFNNLSGEFPSNFTDLSKIEMIYLTRNLLSGPVPGWMLHTEKNIDLSYNNFSFGTSQDCQLGRTNLFGSSSKGNFLFRRTSQLNIRVVCAASSAAGSSSSKGNFNPYEVLGVSPVAGFEVVNEAYARKHKDAQERRDEATAAQLEEAYDKVLMAELEN